MSDLNPFSIYSPAHFLVWKIFSPENWFHSFISLDLGLISLLTHALVAYNRSDQN
ncbi:hypothetical protein BS47DRAFT_1109378 [Hydnum rufescens UP504]|uniref:Uncharacterized protein n=1 Tax=Hydnum rufescens UP504 TaxID=1448309 RepID=A0A9P6AUA5_9AGAM|nr:hypothetical protein BS47DRAFT_1109378 [Hydnum rufescens UP504]